MEVEREEANRILSGQIIKELPDKAKVKWPKKRKPSFKTTPRRSSGSIPIRNNLHIQVATEANLDRTKCSLCGVTKSYGHFDIHHVNNDPNDHTPDNLVILCRNCHIAIQNGYAIEATSSELEGTHCEDEGILEE
jgi:hypothetical protein